MAKRKSKNTYKKQRATAKKTNSISWLVAGIVIGLIVPSLFLLRTQPIALKKKTEINLEELDTSSPTNPSQEVMQKKHSHNSVKKQSSTKVAKYDFYNLMSPDEKTLSADEITSNSESKIQLEIGTFKDFDEADELKARLVLMGFDALIIKDPKNKLAYKVISGPFPSKLDAAQIQGKLRRHAINSILVVN